MVELLLLRHGKAKKGEGLPDAERPLKNSGKRGAQKMGVWLQTQGIVPDCILSSPAERAQTTAAKCIKSMGRPATTITTDARLYEADAQMLLDIVVENCARAERIMLVGHNPALERLIEQLLPPEDLPPQSPLLPPGALVHIAIPETEDVSLRGRGRLLAWTEPGQLPDSFPYAVENRVEQRERPAYYYTQSAVIPYRVIDGELELMMITSSSGRWWGVPKGIVEPGLSEQDSAAKEALEEAGIEGRVYPKRIGHYRHHKWGASCDVGVYAMRVEHELSDEEWDEDHRIRRWVPIRSMPDNIKNSDLKIMLYEFPDFLKGENLWPN